MLGDGVIAVMQHVADADAAFLGFLKIDVAGDAGASERIALGVEPIEDGIGAVESDDHDGVGILAAFHDGVLVQCEILVHAHAGHVFEHREVLFERSDHRFDDHRHDHQRQVGAVRLGLENSIHFFHLTSRAETLHTGRLTNTRHILPRETTFQMNQLVLR